MGQKILIVDDSATARALFRACLFGDPDYEVIQASQWEDAVEKAESEQPFLIVLDYNMPEKSGSEIAKIMMDRGIDTHYVLLSANTQQAIINEVKALGFFDVLEKPVSTEEVHALLERLS
ncbi:Response regulator gacA [Legionella quinlivanii]|uniref:Response regulator gacA n=1 Tax=Legionella quinlivanii TaxID=45073 RepID=A0A0W0XPK4_9GAMM|nr:MULTISPECIES: response regulator [Legionella]KTD46526.1 Response regulator gacA [Legionella quinlivanii]MCE3046422.1 response regulator [Legionella sp. 16cNR16C]MCW8451564.1 response regulator [Legionella quinlivanii]RAP37098.1 hypothetical protein B1207_06670 [Legionella quinlivanii]SEG10227.1 Response regulator receiver domain-containing protein [Legionella quinlivanii DSM 21216]